MEKTIEKVNSLFVCSNLIKSNIIDALQDGTKEERIDAVNRLIDYVRRYERVLLGLIIIKKAQPD